MSGPPTTMYESGLFSRMSFTTSFTIIGVRYNVVVTATTVGRRLNNSFNSSFFVWKKLENSALIPRLERKPFFS